MATATETLWVGWRATGVTGHWQPVVTAPTRGDARRELQAFVQREGGRGRVVVLPCGREPADDNEPLARTYQPVLRGGLS